jgi:toxin secretion/phage lysis holin
MLLLETFLSPIRDCFPAQVAIAALLILILLDWIFGIGNACMQHEFSSEKMRHGIGHKCSEMGFIVVGIVMDAMIMSGLDIGFSGPILTTIAVYLCIMEVGSLMETFAKINPDLSESPAFKLLKTVHVVHDEEDEANES